MSSDTTSRSRSGADAGSAASARARVGPAPRTAAGARSATFGGTETATGAETFTHYGSTKRRAAVADAVVWWDRRRRIMGERLGRMLGRLGDTVTVAGWCAIVVAVAGLALGWPLGWAEWTVAGLASLVLLVVAALFLLGTTTYSVELQVTDDRVVAGEEVGGAFVVRNTSSRFVLPSTVQVPIGRGVAEFRIPLLRGNGVYRHDLDVPAQHRGIIDVGPVTSVRGDPLGLLRHEITWTKVHELYVHPKTVLSPSTSAGFIRDLEGDPSKRIVQSDIAFHAIREYHPGDPQKNVHWKSTAKTGKLMVRQYEETRRSRIGVVLSLKDTEFDSDDEFELAVSAAASIAVRTIVDHRDLDVAVSEEVPEAARKVIHAIRLLADGAVRPLLDDFSGVLCSDRCLTLPEIARLSAHRLDAVSTVYLVTGSSADARTLQSAALAFGPEVAVVAVVADWNAVPSARALTGVTVYSVGALDDVRHLLTDRVQR